MEPVSLEKMKDLRVKLGSLTLIQREDEYQLKPDRADVILPALDIYIYILDELKSTELIVPKIGLSDGMIYQMYLDSTKN